MASKQLQRLIFLIGTILILSIADAGRPCKTILFITTTSSFPQIENPNFENPNHQFTLYFTNTHPINPNHFISYKSNNFFTNRRSLNPPQIPHNSFPTNSSFRDATLDIMSIVGALLFGVGSGALTAAIMYLLWSMFSPDHHHEEEEEEDIYNPKKMGYVAVPVDNGGGKQVN